MSVIPPILEAEIGKIVVLGQSREKVQESISTNSWTWWQASVIQAMWEM
jgi:hypothetical protein